MILTNDQWLERWRRETAHYDPLFCPGPVFWIIKQKHSIRTMFDDNSDEPQQIMRPLHWDTESEHNAPLA